MGEEAEDVRKGPEVDERARADAERFAGLAAQADATTARIKDLVKGVYSRKNPAKLDELDDLLKKYEGAELDMYERVCKKYGERPQIIFGQFPGPEIGRETNLQGKAEFAGALSGQQGGGRQVHGGGVLGSGGEDLHVLRGQDQGRRRPGAGYKYWGISQGT